MVISEYTKTQINERKRELKYLSIAFVSLLINSLLEVSIYATVLFGGFSIGTISFFWPVLDRFLDLITLVLLVNAFIFPAFKTRLLRFKVDYRAQLVAIAVISLLIEAFWLGSRSIQNYVFFWGNYIHHLLTFSIIVYAIVELLRYPDEDFRYSGSIYAAFLLYLVVPVAEFINIFFYGNSSIRLRLFVQPFPIFAILLLTRVTFLKLVDKAYLRERLTKAERKYKIERELGRMKDEFVSVVSHELRTPLTSIKLYLSLLKSGKFGETNEQQKNAVRIVESESDRLSSLINDLLSLSKLESGKEHLKIREFDLNELKKPIYYAGAEGKEIEVAFSIPENFKVNADPSKITQVFVNLMGNAIKFTDNKGKIKVTAEKRKGEWALSIKDSGRGIPHKDIPKLFDKFYQSESHMTRTKGGTGLGLAIVKKIIDLHKGKVEVASSEGKGSTFTVIVPYKI